MRYRLSVLTLATLVLAGCAGLGMVLPTPTNVAIIPPASHLISLHSPESGKEPGMECVPADLSSNGLARRPHRSSTFGAQTRCVRRKHTLDRAGDDSMRVFFLVEKSSGAETSV